MGVAKQLNAQILRDLFNELPTVFDTILLWFTEMNMRATI
jgi:hypothetical protein